MKWYTFLFRSGAKVQLELANLKVKRNTVSGEFTEISWETAPNPKASFFSIDPSELVAIFNGKV